MIYSDVAMMANDATAIKRFSQQSEHLGISYLTMTTQMNKAIFVEDIKSEL